MTDERSRTLFLNYPMCTIPSLLFIPNYSMLSLCILSTIQWNNEQTSDFRCYITLLSSRFIPDPISYRNFPRISYYSSFSPMNADPKPVESRTREKLTAGTSVHKFAGWNKANGADPGKGWRCSQIHESRDRAKLCSPSRLHRRSWPSLIPYQAVSGTD